MKRAGWFVAAAMAMAGSSAIAEIKNVLHFWRTDNHHSSAVAGCEQALNNLARQHGFSVTHSESKWDIINASAYDVLVFNNNVSRGGPESVLSSDGVRQSLKDCIEGGGSWLGLGAALDYDTAEWDWYREVLFSGCYYTGIKETESTVVTDADLFQDPALLAKWQAAEIEDSVTFNTGKNRFNHEVSARNDPDVRVLQKLAEGSSDYEDHAFTWTKPIGSGRMLHTALGHSHGKNDYTQNEKWLERAMWHWMKYLDGQYDNVVAMRAEGGRFQRHREFLSGTVPARLYALNGKLVASNLGQNNSGIDFSNTVRPGVYFQKTEIFSGLATKKILNP